MSPQYTGNENIKCKYDHTDSEWFESEFEKFFYFGTIIFNKLTWIYETYWLDDYELRYNTNENEYYN